MEDEEIISFVDGLQYHLDRIQEDINRLKDVLMLTKEKKNE